MKKDVILTCFACSGASPCQTWANQYFKDPPIVIVIPGQGGGDFRQRIISWSKEQDVFMAAIRQLAPSLLSEPNFEIGRRALVTFSAGWSAADELFKLKSERDRLDAMILLDGVHTSELSHFIEVGTKFANGGGFGIMAHSTIVPPFVSSTKTNNMIFDEACKNNTNQTDKPMTEEAPPDYITNAVLEKPIPIKSNYGITVFSKDPFDSWKNRGGLNILSYKGDTAETHIYIARYVAERCWKWLGEEWS